MRKQWWSWCLWIIAMIAIIVSYSLDETMANYLVSRLLIFGASVLIIINAVLSLKDKEDKDDKNDNIITNN